MGYVESFVNICLLENNYKDEASVCEFTAVTIRRENRTQRNFW